MAADVQLEAAWANEVRLTGRVSGSPQEREMPSGDVVVLFRLVVPRPAGRRVASPRVTSRKAVTVDTIDIACWSARTRRAALRLQEGETAEVSGSLRRRFFRAGGGAASRYEVDAATVARPRAGA